MKLFLIIYLIIGVLIGIATATIMLKGGTNIISECARGVVLNDVDCYTAKYEYGFYYTLLNVCLNTLGWASLAFCMIIFWPLMILSVIVAVVLLNKCPIEMENEEIED